LVPLDTGLAGEVTYQSGLNTLPRASDSRQNLQTVALADVATFPLASFIMRTHASKVPFCKPRFEETATSPSLVFMLILAFMLICCAMYMKWQDCAD
jgi:hypothetical protein